jgi:hypothetical protein
MPWFPEFVTAIELARRQTRSAGLADPVGEYVDALEHGDVEELETVWPGQVIVFDPRYGEVRGHRSLRTFVRRSQSLLAERHAQIETVASTWGQGRAVVELLARMTGEDGRDVDWPIAVVAESVDDRSLVIRTYCSQRPIDGQRHVRSPVLHQAASDAGDVVGRYQAALAAGDIAAVVGTFGANGLLREPLGEVHRGSAQLLAFFSQAFAGGDGIGLQPCLLTDDRTRCALEYNCVRWGGRDVPPQAGICVFERGHDGLLSEVRVYDDVEPAGAPDRRT